ncbi:enoyl-CoA hydratase-related protein, partial [Burkholderia oklahomensis]
MNQQASHETGCVTRERRDKVLVVTIDHPPVNALSAAVRRGLVDALDAADADAAVAAVLIVGAGRNFIAGADIREFGKPPVPPLLPDVCNRIETSGKPVVVALHGATLGGGLEIALAAHYRI